MIKEEQQAIYDEVFKTSKTLGFDTYDYLPDEANYPFVYMGEQFETPTNVKSDYALVGTSNLTIHIYGERTNRNEISSMKSELIQKLKKVRQANIYGVRFFNFNFQMIQDNSTSTVLWHGILEIECNYEN